MATSDPYANPESFRFKLRQHRFARIATLIVQILAQKGSCTILDLGGYESYWDIGAHFLNDKRDKIRITLINLDRVAAVNESMFESHVGDATDLGHITDGSYDLVHSNSVIEHVGSWEHMKRMAAEVRRVGVHYYVQTPYFWFPVEPHCNSIAFHWLPQNIQARRLMSRRRGFYEKQADIDGAMNQVQHSVLLDKHQFAFLFPDATMQHETFLGLTKSLIATR